MAGGHTQDVFNAANVDLKPGARTAAAINRRVEWLAPSPDPPLVTTLNIIITDAGPTLAYIHTPSPPLRPPHSSEVFHRYTHDEVCLVSHLLT